MSNPGKGKQFLKGDQPDQKNRFTKGKSGNPGGRPILPDEVRDRARSYTLEGLDRLAHWMRSDNPSASVKATEILFDRAWGKSPQIIAGDGENPLTIAVNWTDDDRAKALAAFIAKTKQGQG